MKKLLGQSANKIISFFQAIGRPLLRFGFLKFVLVALLIAGSWQAGNMSLGLSKTKADGCTAGTDYFFEVKDHNQNSEGGTRHPSDKAFEKVSVTNNCDTPVTAYVFKFWCTGIDKHRDDYWGFCYDNKSESSVTVPAHATNQEISVDQLVGNNGNCGSAQVDIQLNSNTVDDSNLIYGKTIFGVAAFQDKECVPASHMTCVNKACVKVDGAGENTCSQTSDCNPQHLACVNQACVKVDGAGSDSCSQNSDCMPSQSVVCDMLTGSPTSGYAPLNVSFNLSGHTTNGGSVQNYKFNFGDGSSEVTQNSGSVSHTFNDVKNYTVTGTVIDNKNQSASAGACQVSISTNTKLTYNHSVCENNACVTKECPDKYTSCSSSCGSNNDCQPGNQYSVCDSMSVSPQTTTTGAPVNVTANLSGHTVNGGSISSYRFDFGDGTGLQTQSGNSLAHTYNAKGSYLINGYVVDNKGNQSGSCQQYVSISKPEVLSYVAPPKTYPKTGPETEILAAITGVGGLGFFLRKFKGFKKQA